ncbi:hypothetical protein T492DRAFT_1130407 [Pavlovales sp. CCMP2436]|nr:hypothetical protein T492DRAFT_1130407 [Pavlovales sp. CCMP2436]
MYINIELYKYFEWRQWCINEKISQKLSALNFARASWAMLHEPVRLERREPRRPHLDSRAALVRQVHPLAQIALAAGHHLSGATPHPAREVQPVLCWRPHEEEPQRLHGNTALRPHPIALAHAGARNTSFGGNKTQVAIPERLSESPPSQQVAQALLARSADALTAGAAFNMIAAVWSYTTGWITKCAQ